MAEVPSENNSNQTVKVSGNTIHLQNSTLQILTGAISSDKLNNNGGTNNFNETAIQTPLRWQHCSGQDPLPPGAILAGEDPDGHLLYVGRAYHEDNQLPAKVVPKKEYAFVSSAGQVVRKEAFEVLCGGSVSWVRPENPTVIPPKAIVGGRTSSGEVLYIGRGYSPIKQMMGKIVPSEQTLYIAYGGWEFPTKHYEYLVEN